jgi:enterochelin esterase family protein
MASGREEAAPTFPTWKVRLEQADSSRVPEIVARFVDVLRAVGTPMIDGPEVHFVYCNPGAHRVMLEGEFNQWGRGGRAIEMAPIGESGVFFHTLKVDEPARLEYKFVVDGEWQTDQFCPNSIDNGVAGQNSYFVVGDFREPPELQWVEDIAHGKVSDLDFPSERLGNTHKVHIYLPPAYEDARETRFPSIYVHDGGEYLDRAKLAIVIDNLIAGSQIPPLIAVMIDPVDRMHEYWANDDYAEFLCTELVPAIDSQYLTKADRRSRAVMGASLGGLISLYAALSYPKVFSRVAGQSSALQLAEAETTSKLSRTKRARFRFYFDVGKYEPSFIPAHQRFTALLRKRRWPCLYQELAGGHNWTSWRAHLKDLLVFLWSENSAKNQLRSA